MQPRVLVASPTYAVKRYALAAYLYTVTHLDYDNYDILLVDNTDDGGEYAGLISSAGINVMRSPAAASPYDRVTVARETIRKYAIENGYDYVLNLETDVFPPADIIKRLLAHSKPYVTTVQYNYALRNGRIDRLQPLCRMSRIPGPRQGRFYMVTEEELQEGPLITIDRSHLGCTLVSVDLLRQITCRHDGYFWDDYMLCDDLRAMGVTLYCDTTVKLTHVTDGTSPQRAREFRSEEWRKQKHDL